MKQRRLVSTYEILGVPHGSKPEVHFDLRVEVFALPSGVYSCRVWIIEEFRIIPTNDEHEKIDVKDREFYADKLLSTEMDAHGFDDIRSDSEEDVKEQALAKIRELFGVGDGEEA